MKDYIRVVEMSNFKKFDYNGEKFVRALKDACYWSSNDQPIETKVPEGTVWRHVPFSDGILTNSCGDRYEEMSEYCHSPLCGNGGFSPYYYGKGTIIFVPASDKETELSIARKKTGAYENYLWEKKVGNDWVFVSY